jgi:hypothetical protein
VAAGPAENDLVDKSSLSSDNTKLTSGIRVVSSMDKTPSGEREDELCISEELNVTDDDDKGEIDFLMAKRKKKRKRFLFFLLIDYVVTQTRRSTLPRALVMSRPLARL